MAYATLDDLIRAFGAAELIDLTDRADPPEGAIDAAVVAAALADADAAIDGYIGARHPLPLAVVPALVRRWACDIARYRLWADGPTETVRRNHDDALRQLRDVADGRLTLPATPGGDPPPVSGGVKAVNPPARFDAATRRDFLS